MYWYTNKICTIYLYIRLNCVLCCSMITSRSDHIFQPSVAADTGVGLKGYWGWCCSGMLYTVQRKMIWDTLLHNKNDG